MTESYLPRISEKDTVETNRAALLAIGCTSDEARRFASVKYDALPKWLRNRIKTATIQTRQNEPRKLKPAAGELAFYISPKRFPRNKTNPA